MASGSPNAFLSNFMQGFSFIDDINSRKRRERLLEDELESREQERLFRRGRQLKADALVDENRQIAAEQRRIAAEDRDKRISDRRLEEEGNRLALMGDDASDDDLIRTAPFSAAAAGVMAQRVQNRRRQANFETVFGTQAEAEAQAAAAGQPAVNPATEVAPQGFVEALAPPGDDLAPQRRVTDAEINAISRIDPERGRALRDAQNERPQGGFSASPEGSGSLTAQQVTNIRNRTERADVNGQWGLFIDHANPSGDALRDTDSSILTADYFQDRGNLEPEIQRQADIDMAPVVADAIQAQQQILAAAEPGSRDARNATRKLSQAYGLAQLPSIEYSPADEAGVKGGLPLNGRNPELTQSVVEATPTGPGPVLPRDPDKRRADLALVTRPARGNQLSKAKRDAAYNLYKDRDINFTQYQAYLNTGALPTGTTTSVGQTDPSKDTWITTTDGAGNVIDRRLLQAARDPDKLAGRNVIGDDALSALNATAKAYDTNDYPTRGTDIKNSFLSVLEQNEAAATAAGYDLENIQDTTSLYQRYIELFAFREAFNDELAYQGDWLPEFSDHFPNGLAGALFSRDVDTAVASGEFEDVQSGDTIERITPLKGLTQADFKSIRANVPELADATDAEIQQVFDAQTRR